MPRSRERRARLRANRGIPLTFGQHLVRLRREPREARPGPAQAAEERGTRSGDRSGQQRQLLRDARERPEVIRGSSAGSYPSGQTLKVRRRGQVRRQDVAQRGALDQLGDDPLSNANLRKVSQR